MILFIVKLISSIRKAIAGRKHPSQMAWAVAMGVLLGMIPHGNLAAIVLILFVLLLQVNHAMVALVGVALTFFAPKLDPQFDALGRWVLEQPQVNQTMTAAWQLPGVPWTDLNNTVVMGSLLIGLASIVPTFLISYPIFRRWAAMGESDETSDSAKAGEVKPEAKSESNSETQSAGDGSVQPVSISTDAEATVVSASQVKASSGRVYDVRRVDPPQLVVAGPTSTRIAPKAPVSTQVKIESARKPERSRSSEQNHSSPSTVPMTRVAKAEPTKTKIRVETEVPSADDQQKIDEALSYLLRQLRDSQDKDAA